MGPIRSSRRSEKEKHFSVYVLQTYGIVTLFNPKRCMHSVPSSQKKCLQISSMFKNAIQHTQEYHTIRCICQNNAPLFCISNKNIQMKHLEHHIKCIERAKGVGIFLANTENVWARTNYV